MKPLITPCALLSLLAVAAMAAEPVFLVDEDDTRHGPFELTAKTELPLRGHVYRIEGLPDEAKAVVQLLQQTKLPPFQFNEARLPELIQFVRENAAKQNPKLAEVGFLVMDGLPEGNPQEPDSPTGDLAAAPDAAAVTPPGATDSPPSQPTVSFQAEAMSVWDFLATASALFGYRLDVDAKVVRLLHPRVPDGPLYRKVYGALPSLNDRMTLYNPHCDPSNVDRCDDMKAFLSDLGVGWPDGSSVQHYPTIGKLVAVNTLENHRVLKSVLGVLCYAPRQVEIDCQFVALPRGAIEKAARSGRVSSATVLSLVRDGQGTLLACPKVVTKNGSEATIKGVVEVVYPTEFTVGGSGFAATNEPPSAGGTAVEPGGFETREVGVVLQVVPDVTPDGSMINLTLAPHVVYPPEWRDYAASPNGGKEKDGTRPPPMEQPFFPVDSVTTSVQIYNGGTLVIGGGVPSKDGKTFTYMLISATLVDPNGVEVRTDDDGTLAPFAPLEE